MDEPRRSAVRLTQRDRRLLSFAADHRLILPAHVQALLGVSAAAAARRLRALAADGYLQPRALLHQQPSAHLITARGLAAIDSPLPRPRLDLRQYLHDVGVAWLWLAAARGRGAAPAHGRRCARECTCSASPGGPRCSDCPSSSPQPPHATPRSPRRQVGGGYSADESPSPAASPPPEVDASRAAGAARP